MPIYEPMNWTMHNGEPCHENLRFFANPPEDLGELLSVGSDLGRQMLEQTRTERYGYAVVIAAIPLVIGILILIFADGGVGGLVVGLFFCFFAVVLFFGVLTAESVHINSFVFDRGVAMYKAEHPCDNISEETVVHFDKCFELQKTETVHTKNNVYSRTTYSYWWRNTDSETSYSLDGEHSLKDNAPSRNPMYDFVLAAENAWNQFYREHHLQTGAAGDPMVFDICPELVGMNGEMAERKLLIEEGRACVERTHEGKTNRTPITGVDAKPGTVLLLTDKKGLKARINGTTKIEVPAVAPNLHIMLAELQRTLD
jgi:hypothetical protein